MKPSRRADPYWMLLPTLLFLFVFFLFPLGMLIKQSFFSWDLLTDARYVGLGNYRALLRSGELWHTFTTTLSMSTAVVLGSMAAGLGLALLLDRPGRWAAFLRGAVFSAYVVSWVSVALLFLWLLDADSGIFQDSGAPCAAAARQIGSAIRGGRRGRWPESRSGRSQATRSSCSCRACKTCQARFWKPLSSTVRRPARASVM